MFEVPRITTAQQAPHPRLLSRLQRHLQQPFARQPGPGMQAAFAEIAAWRAQQDLPLVLDAGCGRGHSTRLLAEQHPGYAVLGLDKSSQRLTHDTSPLPANAGLFRIELVDFWLLAAAAGWCFEKVYLLYPNPWPKAEHLKHRWHGHAIFPYILHSARAFELRCNWQVYAQEFARCCGLVLGGEAPQVQGFQPEAYLTAFERKYALAGQGLYRVVGGCEGYCLPQGWV